MDNVKLLFEWLKQSHVHIKDWSKVEEKIQCLVKEKHKKLQVIADFDFTLTKFHIDGQKNLSTYGVMESYSTWPLEFKKAISLLKSNYYRIDNDPLISRSEKIPILLVLLRKAFEIMLCSGLQEDNFKMMADENPIELRQSRNSMMKVDAWFFIVKFCTHNREGVLDFFEGLGNLDIPFLILSAGLGNVILQVLNKYNLQKRNLKVIANHVKCRENATDIGDELEGRLVHPYNKGDISLCLSSNYFASLSHCKNIIVLGDALGDVNMSCGARSASTVMTIGFLNEKIEDCLESYMEHYDIVLADDQTFDIPNCLIKLIVG